LRYSAAYLDLHVCFHLLVQVVAVHKEQEEVES